MRVIALRPLKQPVDGRPAFDGARAPALAWYRQVLRADWASPAEVKRDIGSASILKDGRVVFSISGDTGRIVARINYPYRVLCIRFVGTHAQYDRTTRTPFEGEHVMEIKPIRTKRDYRAALGAVERLMGAKRHTPEGDRLDVLATLIEAYEARHFPLDLPDPVAAIRFVMEQRSLTAKDLVPYIGQPNRVYEILNRKRPLTLAMAWKLHRGLGIPAESLIRQAA
jgi:HTH-type transcriptional regulator/antitoxin HigA